MKKFLFLILFSVIINTNVAAFINDESYYKISINVAWIVDRTKDDYGETTKSGYYNMSGKNIYLSSEYHDLHLNEYYQNVHVKRITKTEFCNNYTFEEYNAGEFNSLFGMKKNYDNNR